MFRLNTVMVRHRPGQNANRAISNVLAPFAAEQTSPIGDPGGQTVAEEAQRSQRQDDRQRFIFAVP